MILTGTLVTALLLAGTYKESKDILSAYYPKHSAHVREILPPQVGYRNRSWVNVRYLRLARGHTLPSRRPQVIVSKSGGPEKTRLRLRHEFMHWLIYNSLIPQDAHKWVDHYWTKGT